MPKFVLSRHVLVLSAIALIGQSSPGQEEEAAPLVSPKPAETAATAATPSAAPTVAAASPTPAATPVQLTDVLCKGLKARSIGPAVMGGRVSAIALALRNPAAFYVGLATGGLFKTGNNGVSFDPVFDKQPQLSIGAVAVAPSDS